MIRRTCLLALTVVLGGVVAILIRGSGLPPSSIWVRARDWRTWDSPRLAANGPDVGCERYSCDWDATEGTAVLEERVPGWERWLRGVLRRPRAERPAMFGYRLADSPSQDGWQELRRVGTFRNPHAPWGCADSFVSNWEGMEGDEAAVRR
jgi:hypothetical protein